MNKFRIPFNRPYLIGNEIDYTIQAISNGHISGDGNFTKKCHELMGKVFGIKKVLLTHSCTGALEMAAILCQLGPGDEVILPSFTHVSTANAFFSRGIRPVFVDIRPDTLNINEKQIEDAITENTKAIIPVHYAGTACEMSIIMDLAKKYSLYVIEDAAMGINAKYKDKFLGAIGDLGAYSFHETKNIICGEGGAIAINNRNFIERAEIIREKGTDRSKFYRNEVDKYTWLDMGSSYLPSDMLAAFLFAQLENMDKINKKRQEIFNYYYSGLLPLRNENKLELPYVSDDKNGNYHIFYIILKDEKIRNELMSYLQSKGILAVFHYLPLHLSPVGRSLGYSENQLPVTESISGRILRLPFYYGLTLEDQDEVIRIIKNFL